MARFVLLGDCGCHVDDVDVDGFDGIIAPGNCRDDDRDLLPVLDDFGIPVYAVPGGDDCPVDEFRSRVEECDNVVSVHDWVADVADVRIVGKGGMTGPEYPKEKGELEGKSVSDLEALRESYQDAYKRIGGLLEQARQPIVVVTHTVPYDTMLDEDANGDHTGSVLARECILEYSPVAAVGRHGNHEVGKTDLDGTTVINTGDAYSLTVLEIEDGSVERLEFKR